MTRKEQIKAIEDLLNKYDRSIQRAFMAGVESIENKAVLAEIERLIVQNNLTGVISLFDEAVVASSFAVFNRELQNAMIAGGDYASRISNASGIEFSFDVTRPSPSAFFNTYRANKVRQINSEITQTITQIVRRESLAGTNPNKTAKMVRDGLGLTRRQEQAVSNYRAYLDNLERSALERELRDKRYDRTVRRAMKVGKPLSAEQKDKMVNAYRRKYIRRRSLNIARTESLTMVNQGQQEYWKTATEAGVIDSNRIKRKWVVTPDSALRDAHASIPRLNPDGVGLNEPFRSSLGLIRYPGDPAASAANRINCRCTTFTRIV